MSDTDPLKPSTKTSTVPLKKETVRITLRARPEESGPVAPKGATAPVAPKGGTAPVPEPPTTPASGAAGTGPTRPVDPTAPAPPTDSTTTPAAAPKTAPMVPPISKAPAPPPAPSARTAPAPPPAPGTQGSPPPVARAAGPSATPPAGGAPLPGAKTIPLAKKPPAPPGAAGPVGAKTIPLAKAPGPPPAPGRQTAPLTDGGAKPLPKATVKLQKTQPMGSGVPGTSISKVPDISTVKEAEEDWDEEYEESGLMPFAIIVLLFAIAVLAIEFLTWTAGK